jgi:hypothetical protein
MQARCERPGRRLEEDSQGLEAGAAGRSRAQQAPVRKLGTDRPRGRGRTGGQSAAHKEPRSRLGDATRRAADEGPQQGGAPRRSARSRRDGGRTAVGRLRVRRESLGAIDLIDEDRADRRQRAEGRGLGDPVRFCPESSTRALARAAIDHGIRVGGAGAPEVSEAASARRSSAAAAGSSAHGAEPTADRPPVLRPHVAPSRRVATRRSDSGARSGAASACRQPDPAFKHRERK